MAINRWKGVAGLPYEVVDAKHYDALAARLAEFQRLYRGQVANDGSYPDHLFTADSATHRENGRE